MATSSNITPAIQARNDAENFFKQGNLDMALESIMRAADLQPSLPDSFPFFAAYITHKAAAMNRSFYTLLRIHDPFVDTDTVKKQYTSMVRLLHPDKNKSIAAANAFRIVNEAYAVLSDPVKRRIYNCSKGFGCKAIEASNSCPKKDARAAASVPVSPKEHSNTLDNRKTKADQSPARKESSSSSSSSSSSPEDSSKTLSDPERNSCQSPKCCKKCNRLL